MRRILFVIALTLAAFPLAGGQTPAGGQAQSTPAGQQPARPQAGPEGRPFDDGPVWRITYFRTKPGKGADHVRWLREYRRRILDGQKSQGLIVDYKYFVKPTTDGPNDWNIAEAVLFKSYGEHLDFDEARAGRMNDASLKVFGSVENRAKVWAELRDASREVVSSQVVREVTLRSMATPASGSQ
ncbi:MAG: hypothetical protein LC795_14285 [Acidobacteria bacterium]|nr:hypothetical protein [Acidobacteriota bacterium]